MINDINSSNRHDLHHSAAKPSSQGGDDDHNFIVYQVHLEQKRNLNFEQLLENNNNIPSVSTTKAQDKVKKKGFFDRRKSDDGASTASSSRSSKSKKQKRRHQIEIEFDLDPLPERDERFWYSTNDVSMTNECPPPINSVQPHLNPLSNLHLVGDRMRVV